MKLLHTTRYLLETMASLVQHQLQAATYRACAEASSFAPFRSPAQRKEKVQYLRKFTADYLRMAREDRTRLARWIAGAPAIETLPA